MKLEHTQAREEGVQPGNAANVSGATPKSAAGRHTPGPWNLERTYQGGFNLWSGAASSGWIICSRINIAHRAAESDANARLIAAAPVIADLNRDIAVVFHRYAAMHASKSTPDADAKALANRALAERCDALLAKATNTRSNEIATLEGATTDAGQSPGMNP